MFLQFGIWNRTAILENITRCRHFDKLVTRHLSSKPA
jgi:hypothetical protein